MVHSCEPHSYNFVCSRWEGGSHYHVSAPLSLTLSVVAPRCDTQLPCSEVVVARGGKVIYRQSAGEAKPGVPVSEDSLYRIYSCVCHMPPLDLVHAAAHSAC